MKQDTWFFVAQFIALIAVPQAAALGVSKFVSLSSSPRAETATKVIDGSAYATLAIVSSWVVITGTTSEITAPTGLGDVIAMYVMIFSCIAITVTVFFWNAQHPREAPEFFDGLGAAGMVYSITAVISVLVLFIAGVDLDPYTNSGVAWMTVGALLVPSVVVGVVRWFRRQVRR